MKIEKIANLEMRTPLEVFDIMSSRLAAGSNYTADDSTFPTEVVFTNGRKVGIAFDGDKPYLTVGWNDVKVVHIPEVDA